MVQHIGYCICCYDIYVDQLLCTSNYNQVQEENGDLLEQSQQL